MDCVCQRYHKDCPTRTCADDCYKCIYKRILYCNRSFWLIVVCFNGFQCNSSVVCESIKGFFCDLQTAWRLVLSMKPWSYIWLEFGLFSTIIYIYIFVVNFDGTGKRFSNRKEPTCLPLLNAGFEPRGSLKPNLQQTEYLLTNRLSYRGSS